MKPSEILETIVSNDGSCDWLAKRKDVLKVCSQCPIGRLHQRPDGTYAPCLDVILGPHAATSNMPEHEQNKLYLAKAKELLISAEIDNLLGVKDDDSGS